MVEDLKFELLEKVSLVPGIFGFANSDPKIEGAAEKLSKSQWQKSIIIFNGSKGLKINLSIILLNSINAKLIANEIYSLIEYFLKENNLKLETLNLQIRGIKK